MYLPPQFAQPDIAVMHELIRSRSLATLVTFDSDGLNANHIPLHLSATPGSLGVLSGHVARSNPILNDLNSNIDTLAVFHGPDAYISPSWYATKQEGGKLYRLGITRWFMPMVGCALSMMLFGSVLRLKR